MKILILTCDKNSWVLPLFFHFFAKFWPDCPFPIHVVTGHGEIAPDLSESWEINVFRSDDAIWSSLLLDWLREQNPHERTLLLLEDYLLVDKIDQKAIAACLRIAQTENADFLRLNPCPGPVYSYQPRWCPLCLQIGEFGAHQDYLISTQPTIWKNRFLADVLNATETGWQFEHNGTKRAARMGGRFLGTKTQTLMPVMNLLRRGKVDPAAQAEMEAKW